MSSSGIFVFCIAFMLTEIAILPNIFLGGSQGLNDLYGSLIQPLPELPAWTSSGNPVIDVVSGLGYFFLAIFFVLQMLAWIILQVGRFIWFVVSLGGQFAQISIQYPYLLIINVPIFLYLLYSVITKFQIVGTGGSGGD